METPKVLPWYRVYCVAMALLYVVVSVMGVAGILFRHTLADAEDPPQFFLVSGALLVLLGVPFAAAYVLALVLPPKPWVWIYHLVLICVGLTSACCIPVCVPLLIFWLKPETRKHFGRE